MSSLTVMGGERKKGAKMGRGCCRTLWFCIQAGTFTLLMGAVIHKEVVRTLSPLHCTRERVTVYSDVDDTLQCSAQHHHAGVDMQFPKGTIYPGAVAFQLALSRGLLNKQALPVVLLSARPKVLKWILGIKHSHPIAQAFRAQEARFEETFLLEDGIETENNDELENDEDLGSAENGDEPPLGTEDDFYEYGDEFWDGSGQEPVVVVVKQASSYHDQVTDRRFEVPPQRVRSACSSGSNCSTVQLHETVSEGGVDGASADGNSLASIDEEGARGEPAEDGPDRSDDAGGGVEKDEKSHPEERKMAEGLDGDFDLEVLDVPEEVDMSQREHETDEAPTRTMKHTLSSRVAMSTAVADGTCPWNGGPWSLLGAGRNTDVDGDDGDAAGDYYIDNGVDRSHEVDVGVGGFLQEQGDINDAQGLCPWLDADGRPVIRNSGWRRRSRKALLQYLPLQPIMPLQPILQFLPLGMLIDTGSTEVGVDDGDDADFGGGKAAADDPEAASSMGVDLKRNLYGDLFDFLHNTRSRYVAIGRTKLGNVINELEREDDLARYNQEQRGDAEGDEKEHRGRCVAFVGDSGQGDEIVGRALVGNPGSYEDPVVPQNIVDRTAHVFIHDVHAPNNDEFTAGFSPPRGLPRYVRFKSYAEAALVAFNSCRISVEGLADVVDSIERGAPYQMCHERAEQSLQDGPADQGANDGADARGERSSRSSAPTKERSPQTQKGDSEEALIDSASLEPCGQGAGDLCCARLLEGVAMARHVLDSSARLMWTRSQCSGLTALAGALQDVSETYVNWKQLATELFRELMSEIFGEGGYARRVARRARSAFDTSAQFFGYIDQVAEGSASSSVEQVQTGSKERTEGDTAINENGEVDGKGEAVLAPFLRAACSLSLSRIRIPIPGLLAFCSRGSSL